MNIMFNFMLFVSDDAEFKFFKADDEFHLSDFFDLKQYRVADAALTYRQIHLLDKDDVLDGVQDEEGKWRRFSFKELVFLMIVRDLKSFGFSNKRLHLLHRAFFRDVNLSKAPNMEPSGYATIALGMVCCEVQVMVIIGAEGKVSFFDQQHFDLLGQNQSVFIHINLNALINELLKKLGKRGLSYKTLFSLYAEEVLKKENVSELERQLLNIVRNDEYETIRVEKKNDSESFMVYGEISQDGEGKSIKDLMSSFKMKDYQNIIVRQRGGKVAHFKIEDVYKI